MNEVSADEAVRAYLVRARDLAGGESALAAQLGVRRGKVKAWFEPGPVGIYGRDLFMVRRLTGLSLDEAATGEMRPHDFEGRMADLTHRFQRLEADLQQLRREAGLPSMRRRDRQPTDETAAQAP